ncbi:hypothetical protein AGIG_G26786, partial [Arapaima gigas]
VHRCRTSLIPAQPRPSLWGAQTHPAIRTTWHDWGGGVTGINQALTNRLVSIAEGSRAKSHSHDPLGRHTQNTQPNPQQTLNKSA